MSFGPQVEVPPPGLGSRQGLDALDPNVVRSALAAGISEKHLQEMAGLLRRQPRDNPGDALDESAEEDDCLGVDAGDLEFFSLTHSSELTQWRRPSSS